MTPNYDTRDYNIYIVEPNGKDFHFPYVLCVPKERGSDTLFVETNNEERQEELNKSAKGTVDYLINMMRGSGNKSPIFVPVLPTNGVDGWPYFQQLSKETFDNSLPIEQRRIDLQMLSAIEDAKIKYFDLTGSKLEDKVFMHGYSASGVFAQRFALSHPEIISEVCIGGAIGSIPMPMKEYNGVILDYPAGTNDYEEIFGHRFNADEYKKIKFRYYVAEREGDRKSETRLTEEGQPAPMHDMSYMNRSMPEAVGKNLRKAFGGGMNERCAKQLKWYKENGFDISAHPPFEGIMHNQIGTLPYEYIYNCLAECVMDRIKE